MSLAVPVPCFRRKSADAPCRLKRTGIIDVQNPVEQAFQEGRFEELDDDAEDD